MYIVYKTRSNEFIPPGKRGKNCVQKTTQLYALDFIVYNRLVYIRKHLYSIVQKIYAKFVAKGQFYFYFKFSILFLTMIKEKVSVGFLIFSP